MRSWLRGNRIALLLLPIALITALLASSSRIEDYWWGKGLHHAFKADSSGVAHFKDAYDDGYLTYPIAADISLPRWSRSPRSTTAWGSRNRSRCLRARCSGVWSWGSRPIRTSCSGGATSRSSTPTARRYDAESRQFHSFGATPIYSCVPDDTPGPKPVIGSTAKPKVADGESPRPRAYEAETYVVTPKGVKPDNVRVWWIPPKYAELPVDEASRG